MNPESKKIYMKFKTIAVFIALVCMPVLGMSHDRPNIIFILSDDISPKEYAIYGGKTASPVLEMMAEEGLFFKTAWATPRCIPTRTMLLTGKYPLRTSVFENQVNPRGADGLIKPVGERYENTLGSLMSASGYRTAMIGKIQTGTVQSYGFQRWCLVNHDFIFDMRHSDMDVDGSNVVQENVYNTDFLFQYLHDFTMEEAEDPWFVYMPLNLPHFVRNTDDPNTWGAPWVPELDENWRKPVSWCKMILKPVSGISTTRSGDSLNTWIRPDSLTIPSLCMPEITDRANTENPIRILKRARGFLSWFMRRATWIR